MSWFKKKKANPERDEFKKQFESVITSLNQANRIARIAVGHSINMANSIFLKNYNNVEEFQKASREEQFEYLNRLSMLEKQMWSEDQMTSIGVGLFKMWLCAAMENDGELLSLFSKEVAKLSKDGDLSV
ncbi:MAG: hypothetical protein WD071_10870 [Pseudohongiella sp.]|uniref:hypothetical protein n=1 Tax=Pseudohongiella sp. TaxID=1979412 RepID=UPI0034A03619